MSNMEDAIRNLQHDPRHEVPETYVDYVENFQIANGLAQFEFSVVRWDGSKVKPPAPPPGKRYTACRLVMPLGRAVELHAKLTQLLSVLQQQAVAVSAPTTETKQ